MNSVFNEQIVAEKLSKLNRTQNCIETLSHWCIFHRKKAELFVQTWDKTFHSSPKEQKIPLLYLANDILQNSKRHGTEFVEEFWKVLPASLKDVVENGGDHGKIVVSRLVGIWEERRVFGSRMKGLLDLMMLGTEDLPELELNKKRSRSLRIVKRDSRSIKIKLSSGRTAEKLVSAFHSVLSEKNSEDINLRKCKDSIHRLSKVEKDVAIACAREGDPRRASLANGLNDEEAILKQCIEKLKSIETSREALVSQLKEALQEQESELENVRTQLQVAQAQIGEACNMRRRLNNEPVVEPSSNGSSAHEPLQKRTTAAIAAEVVDQLAASTDPQELMTSVLSTFAKEAKNTSSATASSLSKSLVNPDKISPSPASTTAYVPVQQQQTVLLRNTPIPNPSSVPPSQIPQYNMYPPPTPQYLQPSTGVMFGMPYTYTTIPQQPPPPPMGFHQAVPFGPPLIPVASQQPAAPPAYYRPLQPPGNAFYLHPQSQ